MDYVGRGRPGIEFHNTGLYNLDGSGAYPAPIPASTPSRGQRDDMGRFRAPTLRNIALTAPYMHDGSIATLAEVLEHYEAGGRTLSGGQYRGRRPHATCTRARS